MEVNFEKKWEEASDREVIEEIQSRLLTAELRTLVADFRQGVPPSPNSVNIAPDNPDTPAARIILREARLLLKKNDSEIRVARLRRGVMTDQDWLGNSLAEMLQPAMA